MPESITHAVVLFAVAFVANGFAAMAGGGVGLIQLPALLLLGLPFSQALATHKVASVALGLGSAGRYARRTTFERTLFFVMLAAGVPGALIGALAMLVIPGNAARWVLGFLTISLGLYSLSRRNMGQEYEPRHRDAAGLAIGAAVLFGIGLLNGSITAGTGLFSTLWLVRWFGLDYKRAVAYTLTFVGIAWNATGAVALGAFGAVAWSWLPPLLAGALAGSYTGAHVALGRGNKWIKTAFEMVTIAVGARLLF
ncbi:MAG: sulfite exporter TauE/SafE family protein [Gammaproteobacteria bacterium]|nr:sulfite exporter TauE/SafE family protein [Gammaproteobacteria bacterium]